MSTKITTKEEDIQSVRSASCPSLSGRSTITYDIGSKGDSQYIRLSGNSAGGLFCKEWVSLADIRQLMAGVEKVTSKTLQPLYAGRSSNSSGFLCACILHENMQPFEQSAPDPQKKPAKAKKNTAKE